MKEYTITMKFVYEKDVTVVCDDLERELDYLEKSEAEDLKDYMEADYSFMDEYEVIAESNYDPSIELGCQKYHALKDEGRIM